MKTICTILLFIVSITAGLAQQTVGLFKRSATSEDGYVLFSPLFSRFTYLMDKCGKEVHAWESDYRPGNSVYLLPNGSLLRTGNTGNPVFAGGTPGGVIEMRDWDNNLTWSYTLSSATECAHHDICPLPNGNILAIVWELKTRAQAIAAGRDTSKLGASMWTEKVLELQPIGTDSARIVWSWDIWDHLVQDRDPALPNYGNISAHPELVNVNHSSANPKNPDWLHFNALAYNEDLDQIMVSSFTFNEFWIIDHSTDNTQSAAHAGGRQNKGGDLLYRWGNPSTYGRGNASDRRLFVLHDAHWIKKGLPDAGRIMVYNNGQSRPDGSYSSVVVVDPPVSPSGAYQIVGSDAYEPKDPMWEYKAPAPTDFYSPILSGAQRLQNGNTLVCEGTKGQFFEVDYSGNIVWRYINPVAGQLGPVKQGEVPAQNVSFRCIQYPADYAGFTGHPLNSGNPIEKDPFTYDCLIDVRPLNVGNLSAAAAAFGAVNPFGGHISLTHGGANRQIRAMLINYLGQSCGQWDIHVLKGKPTDIAVPQSLAPGAYFLRIDDGGRQTTLRLQHN